MLTQSAMSKGPTAVWLPSAFKSAQMQMTCALNNDMSVLMEILLKILKPNMDHGFPLPAHRMSAVEIETTQKNEERNHAFLSGGSHRVCLAESVYTCLYSSLQVVRARLLHELYNTKEGKLCETTFWKNMESPSMHSTEQQNHASAL